MFLYDGFSTVISFPSLYPLLNLVVMEKEVTPPPVDGGGPIDTTTMRNSPIYTNGQSWRTRQPKLLATLDKMTLQVSYDPGAYSIIINSILQITTIINVLFPDGGLSSFIGWMDKFAPASEKEGEFPLAEIDIYPGLQQSRTSGVAVISPSYTWGVKGPSGVATGFGPVILGGNILKG